MKLSKQSLMNALILATEKTASLVFAGAQNALQDGTLEIEGYERVQWIRFDPNDPKTYPPTDKEILVWGRPRLSKAPKDVCRGYLEDDRFCMAESADDIWDVSYWRPLPNPPTETEVVQ